ncbi:MAG: hypothetical protein A2521_03670 [Deltaproteobacteria bacterium RIFOXYD12_FULL_57_12]|nr:MAG: hypothetical protein A2521_03670 [Deltaproteobacteria bacterium RIFOXYD12_FULL_57_12]
MPTTPTETAAGFLQFDVVAGDLDANLRTVKSGLAELAASTDQQPTLMVLPELWTSGFDYERLPDIAGQTPAVLAELHELAAEYRITLAGSLPERAAGRYYNTLFVTGPEGQLGSYRKQRLFAPMAEDTFFSPGEGFIPIDTAHGRLACLVCFDLRFPELTRAQTAKGATLLVIAAQWPMARKAHWQTLVRARAIENQMYVIAANRCGTTNDTEFAGHSLIVAPDGVILHEARATDEWAVVSLDPELTATVRRRFSTVPAMP